MSKLLYDELYELTINFDRHQFINLLMQKDRKIQDLSTDKQQLNMLVNSCQNEIRKLKEQLEECQLQNFNLREDIIIKKLSFPNKEIKDKSLLELYNMPSYEDLKKENQKLKRKLQQKEDIIKKAKEFIEKHNETIGKLYFKCSNMYLLSVIKEDLLKILDNKGE